MSVVSLERSWESEEYRRAGDVRERRAFYSILATPPVSGDVFEEIEADDDMPKEGDPHPSASDLFVKSVRILRGAGPNSYVGEVLYSSERPLTEEYEVSIGGLQRELIGDTDANGVPIVNPVGEPFDNPPRVPVEELLVTITKSFPVATVDLDWLETYRDKTNSTAISTLGAAGEVRIVGVPGTQLVRNPTGDDYYRVTFRLHIRRTPAGDPEGTAHWRKILNQGYRYLLAPTEEGGTPTYRVATDKAGLPLNRPVLLKESGALLEEGGDPTFSYWAVYQEVDMEPLGLEIP